MSGPSITVDPEFPYYHDRSPDSVAEEVLLAGHDTVHLAITSEPKVNGALIRAMKARGLAVWALVFGNGTYTTEGLPPEWPQWQPRLINPGPVADYTFFSQFHPSYVRWKKAIGAELVAEHPVDGYEIMEAYFPEWNGLYTGVYGDIGPFAQAAFRKRFDAEPPNFTEPDAPDYYESAANGRRYRQWVRLRVDAVNAFVDEVINGPGGVRAVRPDIKIATWSAAVGAGADAMRQLREEQGQDTAAMVRRVQPDLHYFQTHWPDWTKAELDPDYAIAYEPFVAALREVAPDLPVGVQADIGSQPAAQRGRRWLAGFASTATELGCQTWTAYEYHIGGYMYAEPPTPVLVERLDERRVRVAFSKRLAADSVRTDRFSAEGGTRHQPIEASVDGHRSDLVWDRLPDVPFVLAIDGVTDSPRHWLHAGDRPANVVPPGTRVDVT